MIISHSLLVGAVTALAPMDMLTIQTTPVGSALPASWSVRAVRGQRAPTSIVRDSAGERFLRLSGTGAAGWFVHRLPAPMAAPAATSPRSLAFSWRVLAAPAGADLRSAATDDAPLRLFVVFASRGRFERTPRTLFYSVGSVEPRDYSRASFASSALFVIRLDVDSAAAPTAWRHSVLDPFADYARVFREAPRAIVAVGLMQDTDQTRATAIADIRTLTWRTPDDTR